MVLLLSVAVVAAIQLMKQAKTFEQRWVKATTYITSAIMLLSMALISFEMTKDLIHHSFLIRTKGPLNYNLPLNYTIEESGGKPAPNKGGIPAAVRRLTII